MAPTLDDLRNQELTWRRSQANRRMCQIYCGESLIGQIERTNLCLPKYRATFAGTSYGLEIRAVRIHHITKVTMTPEGVPIAELTSGLSTQLFVEGTEKYQFHLGGVKRAVWRDASGLTVLSISNPPRGEQTGAIRVFEAAEVADVPLLILLAVQKVYFEKYFDEEI